MIGRLGISQDFQSKHLGSEVLSFIKAWFVDPLNKTGCRFLLVDSYNKDRNLKLYQNNEFKFLFSTEEQEREFRGLGPDKPLNSRLMYFDLIELLIFFISRPEFGIFLNMNKLSHSNLISLVFMLSIASLLTACVYEDEDGQKKWLGWDVYPDYCEINDCLPLTARVHRPTVIKIDGIKADSNVRANLAVLSCELLPGENADSLFPACVDSVKFGNDNKLHHIRANDGRSQVFAYEWIEGPVDSDNHFRFTFVDANREEKSFDIDLNEYVKMHKRIGDSIHLSFPQGVIQFEGVTLDTSFDKSLLPENTDYEIIDTCARLSNHFDIPLDSLLECRSYQSWVKPEDMKIDVREGFTRRKVENVSDCKSPDTLFIHHNYDRYRTLSCFHFTVQNPPENLSLVGLRSYVKLKEVHNADEAYKELLKDFGYYTWFAKFGLGKQGSMNTDSLIIEVSDPYGYYD